MLDIDVYGSVCLVGVEYQDHRAFLSLVPIYIVTNASQLPKEFLFPSGAKQLVIGFDCEGIDLGRYGTLCIMQVMIYTRVSKFRVTLCHKAVHVLVFFAY